MKIKPILFNTEMVRALLDGRKSVTRRVVKPPALYAIVEDSKGNCVGSYYEDERGGYAYPTVDDCPYKPGDILYVRARWRVQCAKRFHAEVRIEFKAGGPMTTIKFRSLVEYDAFVDKWADDKWHPSIHMPKEAARLFLRVTSVTAKHVQDITDEDAQKEGCADREDFHQAWNDCYAKPRLIKDKCRVITHYESYPWEDIREIRTYKGKPWHVFGNPWTWAVEFERCERPREAQP